MVPESIAGGSVFLRTKTMLKNKVFKILIALMLFVIPANVSADPKSEDMEACLKKCFSADRDQTEADALKKYCKEHIKAINDQEGEDGNGPNCTDQSDEETSAIDIRLEEEEKTSDVKFVLTPHRANYLIPFAYNESPNYDVYGGALKKDDLDNLECKFQFSIKHLLFENIFRNTGDIYFAYTNLSYWQAYNTDLSSPFRDTSHEPELWIQFDTEKLKGFGFKSRIIQIGAVHQSNGRSDPLSRSWNRLFADFTFENGNIIFGIKPWWRIPEKREEDNNPDIHKYLGYGDIEMGYKWRDHTFTLMFRNNLRPWDENKGAIQLAWSFPLHKKLKGYFQYFNGYGQTMLDYNDAANTFGIGIALSDLI